MLLMPLVPHTNHMINQHPITPPTELVSMWRDLLASRSEEDVLIFATQWGADQELEACCEWLELNYNYTRSNHPLRTARRPKLPSLKEQAKFAAAVLRSPDETCSIAELQQHWHTICKALEELPND